MILPKILFLLLFSFLIGCEEDQTYSKKIISNHENRADGNISIEGPDLGSESISRVKEPNAERPPSLNEEIVIPIDPVSQIQSILIKANPDYKGQGKLHEENGEIIAAEFPNCGLKDLSPLRGLQLQALDLSGNPVRELRHLRGMPLVRLYLEFTLVESLVELVDAQLVELRLNGSPVQNLTGLEGQPLENLYAVGKHQRLKIKN